MTRPIYLDHNATTPVFPEVVEAMRACWAEPYFNPASQHSFGRRARRVLEDARERIGELLGASPQDRVIFTSGGTEANNLAIRGLIAQPLGEGRVDQASSSHLIVSAIEHPSIAALAAAMERDGVEVSRLGVDSRGIINDRQLPRLLRPETRLVVAMYVNNETGIVHPVANLARICHERGVPIHTDASQAAGKLPINFRALGVSTMTIAAHKFGGPVGIGALLLREQHELQPHLLGGFQQHGIRPGTESVSLAVGMRTALEMWHKRNREWADHLQSIREAFEKTLQDAIPEIQIIGISASRLLTTSNIAFVGLDRQQLFLALDQAGVACSTGSACASGSSEPSPVHIAMGLEPAVISSALRFSFGVSTTADDVDEAARRIINVCNGLRR